MYMQKKWLQQGGCLYKHYYSKEVGSGLLCSKFYLLYFWAMLKNQAYYAQYYTFIMLNKIPLDYSIVLFYWLLYKSKWLLY